MLSLLKKEDVWIFDYYFDENRDVVFRGRDEKGNIYEFCWRLQDFEKNKWEELYYTKNNILESNRFKRILKKENRKKVKQALFYISKRVQEFIEKNTNEKEVQPIYQVIKENEKKLCCKIHLFDIQKEIEIFFELNDEEQWELRGRSEPRSIIGHYYESFLLWELFRYDTYREKIENKVLSHPSLRLYNIFT